MQNSESIMAAIGEREKELCSITARLLEPKRGSVRAKLDELRMFAMARLANLRSLIDHCESVDEARAGLAEYFGFFVLGPVETEGKPPYEARGRADFFGDSAMARTDGAGGPGCT